MEEHIFSNGDIEVTYDPKICKHSGTCCKELPEVFRNSVIPWIDLEAAKSILIIEQIKKCPSKALSFSYVQKPQLVK